MEYQAGRGTTALGIVGTILGSIGTAGVLGAGSNLLTGGTNIMGNNIGLLEVLKECSEKDKQIATLTAEKYSDQSGLELYKYFQGKLDALTEKYNTNFAEQAIINANVNASIKLVSQQAAESANLLTQLTETVIPRSKICNTNPCCNGYSDN